MAHLIVSLHVQYGHYLFAVHCDKNFARSYTLNDVVELPSLLTTL